MKNALRALLSLSTVALAHAAGFQILEQGASNIGTALAGAVTNANNDASAAFWNPSAGFFVEGKGRIDQGINFIVPKFTLHGGNATHPLANGMIPGAPTGDIVGGSGGNAGEFAYVPNFFGIYKFSDRLLGAISMTSPYGLETQYYEKSNFIGRYHGIRSKVLTIDVNPSIAYKIADRFSVSIGASVQYIDAVLTNHIVGDTYARTEGSDWSAGFNLGATWQYAEHGRFAVGFRSQVDYNLNGTLYAPGNRLGMPEEQSIKADLKMPNSLTIGIYQRLGGDLKDVAVMLDYAWTTWGSFNNLFIEGEYTSATTQEDWKNASRISFGVHYYASDKLTLRLGSTWDESPIHSPLYRTTRIPDTDRIWLSLGFGYELDEHFSVDVAYTYLLLDNSRMDNTTDPVRKGDVSGTYTGRAHVIALSLGYRF